MIEVSPTQILELKVDFILSTRTCGPCNALKEKYKDDDSKYVYTMDNHPPDLYLQLQAFMEIEPRGVPALMKYNEDKDKWEYWGHPEKPELQGTPEYRPLFVSLNHIDGVVNKKHHMSMVKPDKTQYLVMHNIKDTTVIKILTGKEFLNSKTDDIPAFWALD